MTTLGNAVPEVPVVSKLQFRNDGTRVPASVISVPCPVCRSEKRVEVFPGTIPPEQLQTSAKYSYDVLLDGHHPIVRCIDCGLYYTCPRDSPETLERVYASGNVESYLKEAEGKLASLRREARFLEKLAGAGGDLLEIGCATGLFLRAAAEAGFRVQGCDPWTEAAAIAAKQFGDCVKNSMFNVADYEAGRFRVVALWDVLEHVKEPVKLVQDIYRLLAPGGWLALSTPNFDSWSRRILQSRWHFLERPHLTFFGSKTIADLLCSAGFSDIRFRIQWKTYSVHYFAGYLAKWSKLLSQAFSTALEIGLAGGRPLVSLPSGCMCVYARKA